MKLGSEEIFYINAFNSISGVNAKDVIVQDNNIIFLVKSGDVGKAIGKSASNIKTLRNRLKKNVEIFGHCEKFSEFVKKALKEVKVKKVEVTEKDGKKKAVVLLEEGERTALFGNMGRIKKIKEIAKRSYGIEEVRIK
ncbi:MAG: NusA-like transcription termination signal-binding factor [archaeon]|jgi:N utilization substance protein A|nr:NusA-like transcription termination signal-binding factor [archaeon]